MSEDSSEPERDALVRGNGVGFFGVHGQLGGVIGATGMLDFDGPLLTEMSVFIDFVRLFSNTRPWNPPLNATH